MEPGDTGRIKTKAVMLGEQKWMIHSVKSLRNIKKEDCDILLLVKCLLPFVSAV